MTYCIYHVPGVKIGVTNNIKHRVEEQQGYTEDEYEILEMSDDINYVSYRELELQKQHGYSIDEELYSKLKCNQMKINVTEMTTTFPCPVNKLKGHLMDNVGMTWETPFGRCAVTDKSINWIMDNVCSSKYTKERCYVYNRAFARWFDNNNAYQTIAELHMQEKYPRTGGIMSDHKNKSCTTMCRFDKIRLWAEDRGLYHKGDPKTQTLKLMEEAGEICRAVLKKDEEQIIDGIGDCVVVLTNLAHLAGTSIEECIDAAYNEIKDRTGKMSNGTFKKD
jgi:NTP pyrophosphatase (non-canonical NTP hydrolase)